MIPTGRQIREGRHPVGMSQIDLATAVVVTFDLIIRAEVADGIPMLTRSESAAVQVALEAAGIKSIPDYVQLRKVTP